ncbi:MAG: YciI family protein [Alphaproteobacteria bacterium]|nr:YciI family protein [Alphaproteobacteria bacterium]MDE2111085.1 YciI family protein [Alphaproteobacteria bacterium]MDE2494785.1 YciI family protein [Alphaproteobacteria bacterium]
MLFMFIAFDRKVGGAAIRAATRPKHVEYTKANGKVRFGGPFVGPNDDMIGSFAIIEVKDYEEAMTYTQNDPYAKAGLFERTELHPWKLTINTLEKV